MRFKITLQLQPEVMGREMPINYQYPLQAAIYHTLARLMKPAYAATVSTSRLTFPKNSCR